MKKDEPLNRNIRCIEICVAYAWYACGLQLNRNIRCIEIKKSLQN